MIRLYDDYKARIVANLMKKFEYKNIHQVPKLLKVVINVGAGEAVQDPKVLEVIADDIGSMTGQKAVITRAKRAISAFKIRENRLAAYSFDAQGNFSFGVPDHTLFEGQKYDPNVGIFGMDICVTMKRPGFRIKDRRVRQRKIPSRHFISGEETAKFLADKFKVEVVE